MTRVVALIALLACVSQPAFAQKAVEVGGKQTFLHVPANARASAVLIPGKGGVILTIHYCAIVQR
jgi:hypothetical protein